jgi:hypothetical protein
MESRVTPAASVANLLGPVRRLAGGLARWLVSLRLAVGLSMLLAAVLAVAWSLEAAKGREYAQWHVYQSAWFIGLLGVLAASVAGAALMRFPRRWSQAGPLIAAAGVVTLLAGCIHSLVQGIEGRLILWPGETAATVHLAHRSQLVLLSPRGKNVQSSELEFSPGPADWPGDAPLDFGEVAGIAVKVLRFYRHARYQADFVADETGLGQPAIQVAVSDAQAGPAVERWCVPTVFRGPPGPGEPSVSMHQASVPSLRDDFLKPPPLTPGSRGVLSVHYKDRVERIPIDGNLNKKLPVGNTGASVEILDYYANAKSSKEEFASDGAEPKNPMLRLLVHLPDQQKPMPEIAYASQPFVTYEVLKKLVCPVKFWYHHPDVPAAPGVEFLEMPDKKLHCRVGAGGVFQPRGEVQPGDRIAASPDCQVTLLRYLPHARREGTFTPLEPASGETTEAEAAALVELTAGEWSTQFWLGRNDAQLGVRRLETPGGPLVVAFGYARHPLGFSVRLAGLEREQDADPPGSAACASRVHLCNRTQDPEVVSADNPLREISTHHPLRYGTFTFHQAGFRPLPGGVDLSVLRVTSDPGRLVKCSGGVLLCVGLLWTLCLLPFVRCVPQGPGPRPN